MKAFAKILRATDGRQVLFFIDYDTANERHTLHCMCQTGNVNGTLGISFRQAETAYAALERVDVETADYVVRMTAKFDPEEPAEPEVR